MKNILLTLSILFIVIIVQAQTDIIYPAEGGNIIFDCKINEVKNGNNVHFTKDSISDVVVAVAITKDGNYIDLSEYVEKMNYDKISPTINEQSGLYKGHNYEYYQKEFKHAARQKAFGFVLAGIGLGAGAISLSANIDSSEGWIIASVILFNIGMPIMISKTIKCSNNKKAMGMTKRNTNLSFSTTNNGVGLVFNF